MSQNQTPTTNNEINSEKVSISKLITNLTASSSDDEIQNISEKIELSSSFISNEDQSDLLCDLGEALYLLQLNDEKAMAFIEKSIQKNETPKGYFYKGMLAAFIPGRGDDDVPSLEKAIELKSVGFYWLELGRAFIRKGMSEKALESLKKYVELDREGAIKRDIVSTLYNLGVKCFLEKSFETAVQSFVLADELCPVPDVQLKGKIVQCYEKLGKKTERDETIQELYKLYKNKSLDKEIRFCRDQFTLDSYENHTNVTVFVYEYFELIGDMALKYLFQVSTAKSILCKISMGSYTFTNQFHMETNASSQPDERLYHLDGYYPGLHKTFGFYSGTIEKPNITYEDLKQKVLGILTGNDSQVISSSSVNQ